MKLLTVLLLVGMVSGCQTIPIPPKFPDIPPELNEKCPDLVLIPTGTEKLSTVASIVATNYGQYNECSIKVEAWQDWYIKQRDIYNAATNQTPKHKLFKWRK